MLIRAFRETDSHALRAIHDAQGFSYPFPDLTNPLFLTKLVLIEGNQGGEVANNSSSASTAHFSPIPGKSGGTRIVGASLLRLTAEAYLLLDPKAGTPRQRWQWLLGLHAATQQEAMQRGLEDVHAWLPPPIATKFGKRLTQLGWIRDDAWTPYCKRWK